MLFSALAWSIGNIIIKVSGVREIFAFVVWASLFAPFPLVLLTWLLDGSQAFIALPAQLNGVALFSLAFQVYGATHFCYWGWNLLLREYPQAQACHRAYGFSMFSLVATGCEYKIGRLGDKWFRMSNVEASRMSEVRNILAHLDPSRRVLVSGAAASPPAEQAERAAQWCRMTAELDAIQTRLAGV